MTEAMHAWHDFYLLLGGAAATLIGLVFVAVSLAHGGPQRGTRRQRETFVDPIVIHFGLVVVTAAFVLVPDHTARSFAFGLVALAGAALVQMAWVLYRLVGHHQEGGVDREHWWWHFMVPLGATLLIAAAAAAPWQGATWAFDALAGGVGLHLVIGLRNAWRLMTWLIERE